MLQPQAARRWAVLTPFLRVALVAVALLLGCGAAVAAEGGSEQPTWPIYLAVLQLVTMVVGGLILETHRRERSRTEEELSRLSERLAKTREQYVTKDDFSEFKRDINARLDGTFKEWAEDLADMRESMAKTEASVSRIADAIGGPRG